GYQSSGQADITKNVLSIGGDTGGNDNENNDDDGNDDNDDNNGDTGEDNNQDPINTGEKFLGQIIASSIPSDFDNYWNQVTTENSCKWGSVESSRDNMNWDQADMAYDYAKENNMPFKFHVLVWGSQEPSWIGSLSQQEQKEEVLEWYQAVAERYPDIDMIDVVNEPLHAPASYRDAIGGSGSTGWDWIVWSFEQAREYFPNAELHLNDYGIIGDPNETENYVEIINILNDRGLIDAIGIQSHHFNMDTVTVSTMNQVLDMLAETELPIYVSELDITGDDNTQLERYQEKFPVLWEHPSVAGVTLWGWLEGHTWRENTHLIKSDGTNRPAFDWLMEYVDNNSGDNGDDDTGDNGDDDDSDSNPDEFDAFSSIEAEDYSSIDSEAIEVIGNNSGGESLGYIENGDSITFNNVDFGNGASTFTASIGTENQSTSIEIRLDNSYGELLGTLQIDSTENWDSYEEQSTDISNVTGTNDLVLVFTGPVNFDWFTFSNEEGSGETGDVNNDGYIDSLDSTLLRRYLLGRVDDVNGDLDGDGGVYSTDYTLLRRYLTGSISSF
ncbi:MAG: endo-1,4-beta-xylanase, partial [bacterium]